jgi:hypothetical protein
VRAAFVRKNKMSEAAKTEQELFSVFARHVGVWEGVYKLIDIKTGKILDQHKSRLTCKMSGENGYWQQNEYTWDDGRTEIKEFPGEFRDGALRFDNARLTGESYEVDPNTIFLFWKYKDQPENSFSEIITLESDTHRCRTWQHFENGEFVKVTVIDERKIS